MDSVRKYILIVILALILSLFVPSMNAQSPAPAPSSDGATIDQGVAYVLMMVALALTYIMH
ncbi:hypothetical protein Lser_V15G32918 [Lactuca serriola]